MKALSVKQICLLIGVGAMVSMLAVTGVFYVLAGDRLILLLGAVLTICAVFWIALLIISFGKRLAVFTSDLCRILDNMMDGKEGAHLFADSETLLARISHRLARLYQVMGENRRKVDEERRELQALVSDISHQVKTPVSNLKMVTDTLLTKPVSDEERTDFLQGIRSQTEKLDFLFQALVKTSRLETGIVRLEKKYGRLFDTVAQAMSGIVYGAEKKILRYLYAARRIYRSSMTASGRRKRFSASWTTQ